jgi:hypothetical protein
MGPLVLPYGWKEIRAPHFSVKAYASKKGLRVLLSHERHNDQMWIHVSVSRQNRIPPWADIRKVKDIFIGRDQKAIMVIPSESEYVNCHPYCMHLFSNLERDPLPDFTRGNGIL